MEIETIPSAKRLEKEKIIRVGKTIFAHPDMIPYFEARGFKKYAGHFHTSASVDVMKTKETFPSSIAKRMRAQGFGAIMFTDHDTLGAYGKRRTQVDPSQKDVVQTAEITIKPVEVNGDMNTHTVHYIPLGNPDAKLGITKKQFRQLEAFAKAGDWDATEAYLDDQNISWIFCHGLWCDFGEEINPAQVLYFAKRASLIELNKARIPASNRIMFQIAQLYGKPVWYGPDEHRARIEVCTMVPGDSPEEAIQNVFDGVAVHFPQHYFTKRKVKMIDSSKKFEWYFRDQMIRGARQLRRPDSKEFFKSKTIINTGDAFTESALKLLFSRRINRHFPLMKVSGLFVEGISILIGKSIGRKVFINPDENNIRKILPELKRLISKEAPSKLPPVLTTKPL